MRSEDRRWSLSVWEKSIVIAIEMVRSVVVKWSIMVVEIVGPASTVEELGVVTDVIADSSKTVINMIHFVSWDTAGPDHAPRAEVYGLGPLEDTRDRQTAVILVALVPTLLRDGSIPVEFIFGTRGIRVIIHRIIQISKVYI